MESSCVSVGRPVRLSELSAVAAPLDGDLQRAHALQLNTTQHAQNRLPDLVLTHRSPAFFFNFMNISNGERSPRPPGCPLLPPAGQDE